MGSLGSLYGSQFLSTVYTIPECPPSPSSTPDARPDTRPPLATIPSRIPRITQTLQDGSRSPLPTPDKQLSHYRRPFFFTRALSFSTTPSDQPPPPSATLPFPLPGTLPFVPPGTPHPFTEATPSPTTTSSSPSNPSPTRSDTLRYINNSKAAFATGHCAALHKNLWSASTSIMMDEIAAEDSTSFPAPPFLVVL